MSMFHIVYSFLYIDSVNNKGPKLSWISNEVDIILLVETWEHQESKVPNIDGFMSIWNKRSQRHWGYSLFH